jgi:hypothetical protein
MRKITLACCLVFLTLAFGPKSFAQDDAKTQDAAKTPPPPDHYYHLDIVVQEVSAEGKPVNSRSYSTTVVTNSSRYENIIRANSRVPFPVGSFSTDAKGNALVNTQFQYQDVGVRFDIRDVHDAGRLLTLNLTADVSTVGGAANPGTNDRQTILRENRWESAVLIPIGKPIVVFKSDDLDSKGSVQVVVTATLLQ